MKQVREAYWIAVVEEGDTPVSIAWWIENHTVPDNGVGQPSSKPYQAGDVDHSSWIADPHAGDVLVFQAPPPRMTLRFPGWANEPEAEPMSQEDREILEEIGTRSWDTKQPRRTWWQVIVDMSTFKQRRKEGRKEGYRHD